MRDRVVNVVSKPQARSVGVDVGGTFTDLVAVHASGAVHTCKVMTTPGDRAIGVMEAITAAELDATAVARFVHGTTVVTNLLLERAGTRVVLLATAGFGDLLWLRRQDRASLYDLTRHHSAPLVRSGDVIAVQERVAPQWFADGARLPSPVGVEILTPLSDDELQRVVDLARASGAQTFAVALLHSHVFADHEIRLRDALLAAMPHAIVATSHDVLPEIREYERTATTVVEAYARPAVRQYMRALSAALQTSGHPEPRVMTSAGGTLTAHEASDHAASLALSGPAGGVTAAAAWCRLLNVQQALTIDVGGTSADVGLIVQGEPLVERGGSLDGIPIALPRVLVETVAAGGGSVGRVDDGGALHAGPASAGAVPGPACYGRGGTRATVTDAHVVMGHIAEGEWGGAVSIRADLAERAMQSLAASLDRTVAQCAEALIATADATMARALRRVSVERGLDPRDMTLVAFGGGGPLHACGLAEALGMRQIIVPPWAGVLSALGLALAPERRDALVSVMRRTDMLDAHELHEARHRAVALVTANPANTPLVQPLTANGSHDANSSLRTWASMRYAGQGHQLDVPFTTEDTLDALVRRFAALHEAQFGFVMERLAEVVSVRAVRDGAWWPLQARREARTQRADEANTPPTVFDGTDDGLALDITLHGPQTVRLPDATLRVAAGWTAIAHPMGGWILEREVGA